jgi:hypothetical protein
VQIPNYPQTEYNFSVCESFTDAPLYLQCQSTGFDHRRRFSLTAGVLLHRWGVELLPKIRAAERGGKRPPYPHSASQAGRQSDGRCLFLESLDLAEDQRDEAPNVVQSSSSRPDLHRFLVEAFLGPALATPVIPPDTATSSKICWTGL